MRYITMIAACLMFAGILKADPAARITEGSATIKPGVTNAVSGLFLNVGGREREGAGAGLLDTVFFRASGGVTNGTVTFLANDGQVPFTLFTVSDIIGETAFRTNIASLAVYTGRIRAYFGQGANTNETTRWDWGVIVR